VVVSELDDHGNIIGKLAETHSSGSQSDIELHSPHHEAGIRIDFSDFVGQPRLLLRSIDARSVAP